MRFTGIEETFEDQLARESFEDTQEGSLREPTTQLDNETDNIQKQIIELSRLLKERLPKDVRKDVERQLSTMKESLVYPHKNILSCDCGNIVASGHSFKKIQGTRMEMCPKCRKTMNLEILRVV